MRDSKILVWDLPTRLFHWLMAASFAGAWLTAESERLRSLHVVLGYTLLGLIAFRIVWGFLGSRYARFASFVTGPVPAIRYLKSLLGAKPEHHVGHNPAGGYAVLALLGLGALAGVSGWLSFDNPGAHWLEEFHEGAAAAMLGLVMLHVGAVVLTGLVHRENLVRAMITGRKSGAPHQGIRSKRWIAAAALAISVIALWTGAWTGTLPEPLLGSAVAEQARAHEHDD